MGGEKETAETAQVPALRQAFRNDAAVVDFRTQDPETAYGYIQQNHGDHYRKIHGGEGFGYAELTVATNRVVVATNQKCFRQTLRAAVRHPTLFLDLDPGDTIRYGRKIQECGPSIARIMAPGHEYTRRGANRRGAGIRVDTDLLQQEVAAQARGRARNWLVQPVAISMSPERRTQMSLLFSKARAAAQSNGSWGIYGDVGTFERAVAGWMASLLLDASGAVAVSQQSLHRLSLLDFWIERNLGEDITLDRMCAVAGISARALQKIVLSARGQTPLEYVSARRLAAVRKQFEQGTPRQRVSSVAFDCGFTHLGRFAAMYQAAFGELPSETVQRSFTRRQGQERLAR